MYFVASNEIFLGVKNERQFNAIARSGQTFYGHFVTQAME
jgi:hypothetical protein